MFKFLGISISGYAENQKEKQMENTMETSIKGLGYKGCAKILSWGNGIFI